MTIRKRKPLREALIRSVHADMKRITEHYASKLAQIPRAEADPGSDQGATLPYIDAGYCYAWVSNYGLGEIIESIDLFNASMPPRLRLTPDDYVEVIRARMVAAQHLADWRKLFIAGLREVADQMEGGDE